MAAKSRSRTSSRIPPRLDVDALEATFAAQLASGAVYDATVSDTELPALLSPRGQSATIDRCLWRAVTLSDPKAQRVRLRDVRIESSDLANIDLSGGQLERVEIVSTRLTGATASEAQFKSVLFQECKLDLALLRMARFEHCVFEDCYLGEADFYSADLTGSVFRKCDLSRADVSQAKLAQADIRDCRLDGMRGMPESTADLLISLDQAALLITLFGVRVEW